jgi:hypothetical protein
MSGYLLSYAVKLVAVREVAMSSMDVGAVGSNDRPSGPTGEIEFMVAQDKDIEQ